MARAGRLPRHCRTQQEPLGFPVFSCLRRISSLKLLCKPVRAAGSAAANLVGRVVDYFAGGAPAGNHPTGSRPGS